MRGEAKAIMWVAGVAVAAFVVGCAATQKAVEKSADEGVAWVPATAVSTPVVEKPAEPKKSAPRIQVALLLDTSGSMTGLIKQAQAQLWKIVNEYATMKKDGVPAEVEVALYQYGTPSLGVENGYIRMIVPLSRDLDKISQELFALTTSGGDEYCGQVIQKAVDELQWSGNSNDLKAIFIAGNEPFTQGQVDYHGSCKAAIAKGIVVHTIHCGDQQTGESTGWKDGATLADGSFLNINKDSVLVSFVAPQDKEIAKLGEELNKTYVAYGPKGDEGRKVQTEQDAKAAAVAPSVAAERVVTKASEQYRNDGWDLVDAVASNKVKIEEVKVEALPAAMQSMTVEQRKEHIAEQAGRRAAIQKQIAELNADRVKFVEEKERAAAAASGNTLGRAVNEAAATQAAKQGFSKE